MVQGPIHVHGMYIIEQMKGVPGTFKNIRGRMSTLLSGSFQFAVRGTVIQS